MLLSGVVLRILQLGRSEDGLSIFLSVVVRTLFRPPSKLAAWKTCADIILKHNRGLDNEIDWFYWGLWLSTTHYRQGYENPVI